MIPSPKKPQEKPMSTADSAPFDSIEQLNGAFSRGLGQMLDEGAGMGTFILVLANALSEPGLYQGLEARLSQDFQRLAGHCRTALAAGETLQEPDDDLMVFLKLMALGYEGVAPPQQRHAQDWQLQFNMLRAFRPQRAGAASISRLLMPFNADGFHFNKPFLVAETFWQGRYLGKHVRLLYNKFPFMPLHGLWVPEAQGQSPQFLLEAAHRHAWDCCQALRRTVPGAGLAYNSLGAGASVNHLHFQLFVSAVPLPIEAPCWRHNGGERAYPLDCRTFVGVDHAWQEIARCNQANIAYNILYRGSVCYLIRRRFQGDFARQNWLSSMTWNELCGCFVLFNRQHFQQLAAVQVERQLAALQP
jgi:hypothetical protein